MRDFITVDEAARSLDIAPRTMRVWCKTGKVRAQRIGTGAHGVWLIDPASLEGLAKDTRGRKRGIR